MNFNLLFTDLSLKMFEFFLPKYKDFFSISNI